MGEEIAFENGQICDFQGLVTLTLTLTLERVILHTVMHHSSTSTYVPNFIGIEETFCGRTDERTDGLTGGHLRPTLLGRLVGVDLIMHTFLYRHKVVTSKAVDISHAMGLLPQYGNAVNKASDLS